MNRRRSAGMWGLVGGLLFLVLTVGFRLIAHPLPLGLAGTVAGAVAIGAVVATASYLLEDRLTRKRRT